MVSGEEAATWQLRFADSELNKFTPPAFQMHTSRSSAGAKAYPTGENAQALPLMGSTGFAADGDSGELLVLEAKSDAADTVESEESNGSIPFRLVDKKTGQVIHRVLRVGDDGTADFSGFNSTHDVALVTSEFRRLGTFAVPRGYIGTLDPGIPTHLYLGDDTA